MRRAGALMVLVAVGGCSAESPPEDLVWSEPRWMAEQAQQKEQFVGRLQACMDARGWGLHVDESGGFDEPFTTMDEAERAGVDRDGCLEEQGLDPSFLSQPLTEASLRLMYRYDVDTHACLVAHGVPLEQGPPSEDVYVEEALSAQAGEPTETAWWPYGDPALLLLEEQEIADLTATCPERWTFAVLS